MSGAPPSTYGRPSVAYVTPSRRATRTALSNSSSARACHLDVATLRRFSPATGGGGGLPVGAYAPPAAAAAAAATVTLSVLTTCLAPAPRPVRLEPPVQRAVSLPAGSPPLLHPRRAAPLHVAGLPLYRHVPLPLDPATSPVWQVGPGFRSTLRLLRCSRLDPPAAFARPAARNATRWLQVQGGVAVCSSPLSSWRCSGTVPTARKIAQAY